MLDAIRRHSAGLATAATGNLDAAVECCPGWRVDDLVWHVTEVHWFWATIAEERLDAPPDESRRPERPSPERLVDMFRDGAERLVRVLAAADGSAPVWTWAPAQHDIAFITRHQVQEAAVHHWDAARARGEDLAIETPVAIDAIDEFLTFSVSSDADPAEPARPALGGSFRLRCTDPGSGEEVAAWTVTDGSTPGTVAFERSSAASAAAVTGTASAVLLWLYGRSPVETGGVPADLLDRFRSLCFTE